MKKQSGFTLIEVMITVGVIAILAAIAAPAYLSQQRKGNRAEVVNALGQISIEMNRCYSDNGGYDCCNNALILPKVLTNSPETDGGHYSINIVPGTADTNFTICKRVQSFTITATAIGDQTNDASCPSFTIDNLGNQTAANPGCWSRQN